MASVYVIDDNENTCKIIKKILESEGHAVKTECCPKKAVEFLSTNDSSNFLSAIFLDLVMPEIDGYELLKLIRKNNKLEKVKVILLTSKDEQSDMMKSYDKGVDYFMPKPANKSQILFALDTVLNSKCTLSESA